MNQPLPLDASPQTSPIATSGATGPEAAGVFDYWFGRRQLGAVARPLVDPLADRYRMDHKLWFGADPAVDEEIQAHFGGLVERAARGELAGWATQPRGAVCLALLLGAFRRRAFRGTPAAHACDAQAVALARSCLDRDFVRELSPAESLQLFLALQLSEDLADARLAVAGLAQLASRCPRPQQLTARAWGNSARKYQDLLERFGRDPQRNAALGRESTEAEQAFLARPDFSSLFRGHAARGEGGPKGSATGRGGDGGGVHRAAGADPGAARPAAERRAVSRADQQAPAGARAPGRPHLCERASPPTPARKNRSNARGGIPPRITAPTMALTSPWPSSRRSCDPRGPSTG